MSDQNKNLKRWMEHLPKQVRDNIPIINLAIPGSNNSMTFGLRTDLPTIGNAGWVPRYFNFLSPKFTLRWFRTQQCTTTSQLNAGIRYLDLKVCKTESRNSSAKFFFVNTFRSVSLFEPFLAIYRFLKKHPKEVIILDFREFCDMICSDHYQLQKFIHTSLGYSILSPDDTALEQLTLNRAEKLKKSVVVIYRHKTRKYIFWPGESWRISTPSTTESHSLPRIMTNVMKENIGNCGHVARFIIRPTIMFIAENIHRSMKDVSSDIHKEFSNWIVDQVPVSCKFNINVVTIDFFDLNKNEFCYHVIKLNEKYDKKNRKIFQTCDENPGFKEVDEPVNSVYEFRSRIK